MDEMVIDVHRMKKTKKDNNSLSISTTDNSNDEPSSVSIFYISLCDQF